MGAIPSPQQLGNRIRYQLSISNGNLSIVGGAKPSIGIKMHKFWILPEKIHRGRSDPAIAGTQTFRMT